MIEGGPPGSARRAREARRRRRRALGGILALVLLAAAAVVTFRLLEPARAPEPPEAIGEEAAPGLPAARAPEPGEPPAEPAPGLEPAPPAPPLPALAESDAFARERVAGASKRPELAAWLAGEGLVYRFVAAVDAVANGESPREQLAELAPREPFRARERALRPTVDPRSWERYDRVAEVFASLDAEACAALHRLLLPLFEAAYAELGRREGRFDDALARAFRELLAAPVPEGEIELVAKVRSYQLADPALEALSPAQKHLLRMGPRNARRVQAKLAELAAALGLESAAASAAR
jgi:hypothetical protein